MIHKTLHGWRAFYKNKWHIFICDECRCVYAAAWLMDQLGAGAQDSVPEIHYTGPIDARTG